MGKPPGIWHRGPAGPASRVARVRVRAPPGMIRKVFNVLFLLGLLPWAGVFVLGVLFFDAPGSESSPLTLGLFYSIASYPLLVVVGFLGSSGFWRMQNELHWRRHLAFLPIVSPVAAGLFLLAIEYFCGGRFSCSP